MTLPDGKQGPRIRKVSPIQTRRGAEEFERKVRESLLAGTYNREEKTVPTFEEFEQEFIEMHVKVYNKPSEIEAKRVILRKHLRPYFGSSRLSDINEKKIVRYCSNQKKAGYKNKTINNQLIVIRTMLGKAKDWGYVTDFPRVRKMPTRQPGFDFLNFEEAKRLERAAKLEPEWEAAIVLALHTGMRVGELLGLQWDDCDFTARKLVVSRSNWQGHVGTTKSGKSRTIPINRRVADVLKSVRHLRGPWVWCDSNGQHLNKDHFKNALRRCRKRAGLRHIGWHTLRHSFASHLVMKNVPLRAVQELMEHASIQMTLRYSHLAPEVTRSAVDLLADENSSEGPNEVHSVQTGQIATNKNGSDSAIRAGTCFGSGGRI